MESNPSTRASANETMPSFCFVVTTWKRDYHYARALLESLLYWHPSTPVRIIVDGGNYPRSFTRAPNVVRVDRTIDLRRDYGLDLSGLLSDLNLFFFDGYDYFVRLDADSVLVGDVLEGLYQRMPFDFLSLDGTEIDLRMPESNRLFSQYAFSPAEMRALGEAFPDGPVLYLSGGHFCTRARLLNREYIGRWLPHMGARFRKDLLFKFNDQSFLNFAVNASSGSGVYEAKLWNTTLSGRANPAEYPELSLNRLVDRISGANRIIHYTGPSRRQRFREHNFGWSLQFFEERWYRRAGLLSRWMDRAARYTALAIRRIRSSATALHDALKRRGKESR